MCTEKKKDARLLSLWCWTLCFLPALCFQATGSPLATTTSVGFFSHSRVSGNLFLLLVTSPLPTPITLRTLGSPKLNLSSLSGHVSLWETVANQGSDLDDPHVEASLLGQLLTDMARGLGCSCKGCLQRLQLLGFDCGPGSPALGTEVLVIVFIATTFLVRHIGTFRVLGIILRWVLGIRR